MTGAAGIQHRALVLAAALLFSTGGAAIKAATLTSWQVASFRSGIAALFLLLVFPEARRAWSWRMLPVSAAYAATLVCFALANRLTTSANAVFLQAAAPFYVVLLASWLLHERVRASDIVFMIPVLAGMILFFVAGQKAVATAPDPVSGNWLAVLSGFLFAWLLVGMRWLGRHKKGSSGVATIALGNVLACLAALPMALPVQTIDASGIAVVAYLGVIQIGLAYYCLARGIVHLPAFQASMLLMLEPAMNPVFAWLVHSEQPGLLQICGGALILGSTALHTWQQAARAS